MATLYASCAPSLSGPSKLWKILGFQVRCSVASLSRSNVVTSTRFPSSPSGDLPEHLVGLAPQVLDVVVGADDLAEVLDVVRAGCRRTRAWRVARTGRGSPGGRGRRASIERDEATGRRPGDELHAVQPIFEPGLPSEPLQQDGRDHPRTPPPSIVMIRVLPIPAPSRMCERRAMCSTLVVRVGTRR